MSGVACHFLPFPNRKSYGPAYCLIMLTIPYHTIPPCVMFPVSQVRCHISLITCHVSHLSCHMSHIFSSFFLLEIGGVSWWRVCYQWGLPRLIFRLFLIKNMHGIISSVFLATPPPYVSPKISGLSPKILYLYCDERRDIWWNIAWARGKSGGRSQRGFPRA